MKKKYIKPRFCSERERLFIKNKMKLTAVSLFFGVLAALPSTYSQHTLLSAEFEATALKEAIEQIEFQSECDLLYDGFSLEVNKKGNINVRNHNVESGMQQNYEITGTVEDQKGIPIPGVNVVEKGTTNGTITNQNGKYALKVSTSDAILSFSFIGYLTEEIDVKGKAIIDLVMIEDIMSLDEVVVVGYGTQNKVTVTGSISSINSEEIVKSPTSSIQNALAGRATGLVSVQRSSEPGRDFADLHIRGLATYGNSSPLILVDGVERDITTIDPNEIESLNILKDASSTAVFGVRGANGVIIITTKTGTAGEKPQISFSANYGLSSPLRVPRFLNAPEWVRFYNMGSRNDNILDEDWIAPFSDEDIELYESGEDPIFHPDVDWYNIALKEYVPQQQYNLNLSGGSEKARYFVSLGYFSQEGSFKNVEIFDNFPLNSQIDRYNIRANTDFQWTKKFSTSVKFSTQIRNGKYPGGSNLNNLLNNIFANSPIVGLPVIDGKLIYQIPELVQYKIAENPVRLFYLAGTQVLYEAWNTIDVTSKYSLDALIEGLSVRGKFAYDNFYSRSVTRKRDVESYEVRRTNEGYEGDYYTFVQFSQDGPWYSPENLRSYSQNYRLYSEFALDYNRKFGNHAVKGLLLGTVERSYRRGTPALPFNYAGLVGRATYNYNNKYLTEFNMGYNGSENFAKGKQFGFFPSYSLGYVISEEPFFPKNNLVTFLKVRGSRGKVGNDKLGGDSDNQRFLYTPSSFELAPENQSYRFGDAYTQTPRGYVEAKIGNPDISWEVATKSNIGFNLKMFDNKLSFSGDLFKEKRTGILGNYQVIPFTFGDISLLPSYNLGIVENHGHELEIDYNGRSNGSFSYWVNANYTFARNKVVYKDEIPPQYPYLAETGLPINQPFMLEADGLFNTWEEVDNRIPTIWDAASPPQPGDVRFIDQNEDGIIDGNDKIPYGYTNIPEIVYGITIGARWKNFDLTVLFQGAEHVSTYYGNKTLFSSGFGVRTEAAYDSWTEEKYQNGEEVLYPRISLLNTGTANVQQNSLLNQDASYIRLKNLEFGYNFGEGIAGKLGAAKLRLYFNGQNLATITSMKYWDPEMVRGSNMQYPMNRVLNFGVKANF